MATVTKLLSGVITDVAGEWLPINASAFTVLARVAGTGAVSVTVTVEVSHDKDVILPLTAISLTGTTTDTDVLKETGQYNYVRATTSSISGTGATVNVTFAQSRDMF